MVDGIFVEYVSIFVMSTIVGFVGAFQAQSEDVPFKRIVIERVTTHGIIGLIVYCLIEGVAPDTNVHLEYAIILMVSLFGIDKAIDKIKDVMSLVRK